MRVVFLIVGAISLLLLIIFAVENVGWYASYHLFNSLNQTGIVAVPIIIGGLLGVMTGFFLAMFAMTKQNIDEPTSEDW